MRSLERRYRLPKDQAPQLLAGLHRRIPWLGWAVLMAFMLSFVVLLRVGGVAIELVLPDTSARSPVLFSLGIALLVGSGILAAIFSIALERTILALACSRHMTMPACFFCGHSLRGLQPTTHMVTCPECGKASPIAPHRSAP